MRHFGFYSVASIFFFQFDYEMFGNICIFLNIWLNFTH